MNPKDFCFGICEGAGEVSAKPEYDYTVWFALKTIVLKKESDSSYVAYLTKEQVDWLENFISENLSDLETISNSSFVDNFTKISKIYRPLLGSSIKSVDMRTILRRLGFSLNQWYHNTVALYGDPEGYSEDEGYDDDGDYDDDDY